MSDVTVRSIDALEELQSSLIRYADQVEAMLNAVQREVQRTLDWLDERVRHWQAKVQRRQEDERRICAAYQRCMASGDRDRPPACGHIEQALHEARRRVARAGAEARLLETLPPGKLRFTFIDPVGLGQNVAAFMKLADCDENLVTGKAWSEPHQIEQQLAALSKHMENVIQEYLRAQFKSIEEYNAQAAQAGEVAEPRLSLQ